MGVRALIGLWAVLAVAADGPVIEVRQRVPERIAPNSTVPVEVTVANVGSTAAHHLTVISEWPAKFSLLEASPPPGQDGGRLVWPLETLGPGESRTFRARLATRGSAESSDLANLVTVTYPAVVRHRQPVKLHGHDLVLAVTAPEMGLLGEPVSAQLTVSNRGQTVARKVALQTVLPGSLFHPAGADLEQDLGDLAPGQTRTVSLEVTPTQPGTFESALRVTSAGIASAEKQWRMNVGELRLELAAQATSECPVGAACATAFVVKNTGTASAPVALMASLPAGIAFRAADQNGLYSQPAHQVVWSLGELKPGEERTVRLDGVAQTAGGQSGRVVLMVANRGYRQTTWATRVTGVSAVRASGKR